MSTRRRYFELNASETQRSSSQDWLTVWFDGAIGGFQTREGHSCFLTAKQVEHLIRFLQKQLDQSMRVEYEDLD